MIEQMVDIQEIGTKDNAVAQIVKKHVLSESEIYYIWKQC